MKIAAGVVTYNRLQELQRCIELIDTQNCRPDVIFVVNNGSTDGTREWLDGLGDSRIQVVHQANLGGAGGFKRLLREQYQSDADLFWIMDDDCQPEPDCLALLEDGLKRQGVDALGPLVVSREDANSLAFYAYVQGQATRSRVFVEQVFFGDAAEACAHGFIHPFNGVLLSREFVARNGLPLEEMFIWGDEKEYFCRAESRSLRFGTIREAIVRHPPERKAIMRMRLFGREAFFFRIEDSERFAIYARNHVYTALRYGSLVMRVALVVTPLLLLLKNCSFSQSVRYCAYVWSGLFGRVGVGARVNSVSRNAVR